MYNIERKLANNVYIEEIHLLCIYIRRNKLQCIHRGNNLLCIYRRK